MTVISWNLHGASVPGRATKDQQLRAWEQIRSLDADLVLAQEVSSGALPDWVQEDWTVVAGERGRFRKNWNWGSVVAAKPDLGLVPNNDALADAWLSQLYDLVIVGRLTGTKSPLVVASIHTAAVSVREWTRDYATSLKIDDAELGRIRRPGCDEEPFLNDLAYSALKRTIGDERFLVAGDWNTCRKYSGGAEFFARARSEGWQECHRAPEQPTYFGKNGAVYQLDHAFTDAETAKTVNCRIESGAAIAELSDHAPLVLELDIC